MEDNWEFNRLDSNETEAEDEQEGLEIFMNHIFARPLEGPKQTFKQVLSVLAAHRNATHLLFRYMYCISRKPLSANDERNFLSSQTELHSWITHILL